MRRWLLRLSLALNVVFLVGALALVLGVRSLFDRYLLGPNRERMVSEFAAFPLEHGDVVFLGDSITQGGNWNEIFPGIPVRNRGVGGDQTQDVLDRLDQITQGSPAQVFLLVGTNDLERGAALETIVANYEGILERLGRDAPETAVFVQSVLPRDAAYRDRVEALNHELEALARRHGANWIDLYGDFLDADGSIRDDYANDELHLLGPGYLRWRERLSPYVRTAPVSATKAVSP